MAAMAAIATVASLASGAMTAIGTIAAGNAAAAQGEAEQKVREWQADQLNIKAKDEFALAQKDMLAARRQKNLALSTLQSRAAGSGFMATDPSNLALADEISKYGTLQEQMALYGGETRRRDLDMSAQGERYTGFLAREMGRAKRTQSYFNAAGTILGSISNMGTRFNQPASTPSTTGRYG